MKRIAIAVIQRIALYLVLPVVVVSAVMQALVPPPVYDKSDYEDPLLNACHNGDIESIDKLLVSGANPNKRDFNGSTPLNVAAGNGQTNAVALLLKHGANVDGIKVDWSPLQFAVHGRHVQTAALLLQHKANPNPIEKDGYSLLHVAANLGDSEMVKVLVDGGAEIEQTDKYGWRPLHTVLRSTRPTEPGRLATVKVLLESGADPNADNEGGFEKDSEHDSYVGFARKELPNRGNKPLAIAESNGFTQIVELLKKHGGT